MKKFIAIFSLLFLLTGCNTKKLLNTPTKKVEMFFSKYQSLDRDVINQLNEVVNDELSFTDEQRKKYVEIMKRHYESLKYEIKDEEIDADTAKVEVEIEVIDYSKILKEADTYLKNNEEKFLQNGEYSEKLFNDYRLERLKEANDYVKYTIEITLTKLEDEWVIDDLTSDNQDKIQGIYQY